MLLAFAGSRDSEAREPANLNGNFHICQLPRHRPRKFPIHSRRGLPRGYGSRKLPPLPTPAAPTAQVSNSLPSRAAPRLAVHFGTAKEKDTRRSRFSLKLNSRSTESSG